MTELCKVEIGSKIAAARRGWTLRPTHRARFRRNFATAAALALATALSLVAGPAAALCGDLTHDGFVTASDALATLQQGVSQDYDALGDIDGGGAGNGRLTASDALGVLIAAVETRIPRCAAATETAAAILTSSFLFDSAGISEIDLDTHGVVFRDGAFHHDAVLRKQGGRVFGVNRYGANSLEEIDYRSPGLPAVKECSVSGGYNSNSHDFLMLSATKGYVTAYEGSELLVIDPRSLEPGVDPACANIMSGTVDLSSLADADGIPEMDQMTVAHGRLFVSLQTLTHGATSKGVFPPAGPARLAVIDTATDELTGSVQLAIENPFAETKGLVYDAATDKIYVGGPGKIFLDFSDGGIESVDATTLTSDGVLITGAELGGDLFDFVIVGSRRAYAVVAEPSGANVLLGVDLQTRSVVNELIRTTALVDIPIADIELTQSGELWVAFREDVAGSSPGIRIFSIAADPVTADRELTAEPIFPGDLPFNIVFVD